MEVHCADSFSNDGLYEAWTHILRRMPGANAQLTHEWLSTCGEVLGGGKRLLLVTATEGGRIRGIAPLTVATVVGRAGIRLRKLTFVGDGVTDYQDLLTAEEGREETLRAILRFLLDGRREWDAIHFRNVRGDSPNLPVLRDILKDASLPYIERVNIRSPYISINRDWTEYYGALGKNMRSDVQRRRNGLARMGKAQFVRLHQIDDMAGMLDTIRSIHIKCWGAKGGASWYADERRFRFASLIVQRFGARKWLDLVFLKLDGRVIAYYLGFAYDHVVHFWNTGFDPEFSAVSPGKLLLHYWIEDSFAAGYREFDFMVGEEPYKLQWTDTTRPNYELFVFQRTARSRLLKCYYIAKPILKKNPYLQKAGAAIRTRIRGSAARG